MPHILPLKAITPVTHDVHHFKLPKPEGYSFTPGQATEVSINRGDWKKEKRPFTFTSLPDWDHLEFTIKSYPDHEGVTEELSRLHVEEELILDDPWGTIEYKGPGTFIAGGAGVTPFIAILRSLKDKGDLDGHRLIFANKTEADIILRDEWDKMPGLEVIHIVSDDETSNLPQGFVDREFLEERIGDFSQHFYVCGPEPMQKSVMSALEDLGADPEALVFEK